MIDSESVYSLTVKEKTFREEEVHRTHASTGDERGKDRELEEK